MKFCIMKKTNISLLIQQSYIFFLYTRAEEISVTTDGMEDTALYHKEHVLGNFALS